MGIDPRLIVEMMAFLALLGCLAGILTTLVGMGGGVFLVAALTFVVGPHAALALSSPSLLLSNAHRAFLLRSHVKPRVVFAVAIGAVPGSVVGGLVLSSLPSVAVTAVLGAMTVALGARALGWLRFSPSPRYVTLAGGLVGALSATSAGAGMLLGPVLISVGLSGAELVANLAVCAVTMHVGRTLGYLATGLLRPDTWPSVLALLAGLLAGNLLGHRARRWIPRGLEPKIEMGALVSTTALAVLGLTR